MRNLVLFAAALILSILPVLVKADTCDELFERPSVRRARLQLLKRQSGLYDTAPGENSGRSYDLRSRPGLEPYPVREGTDRGTPAYLDEGPSHDGPLLF